MRLHHNYFVYIVECKDNFYYTGATNDLERRLWEHNTGFNKKCFTFKRREVELNISSALQTFIKPLNGKSN